jgi:fatty-acyl-CoA synthase
VGRGADDLKLLARERIAAFKVPKAIEFSELPKTVTGKVQKFVLRDTAQPRR